MPRSEVTNSHGGITVETEIMVVDVTPAGRVWFRTATGETFSAVPGETFAISVPVYPATA